MYSNLPGAVPFGGGAALEYFLDELVGGFRHGVGQLGAGGDIGTSTP